MIYIKEMSSRFGWNNKMQSLTTWDKNLQKFVDYSKKNGIFYDNLYLDDIKYVIKMPLPDLKNETLINNIRIEEFNLTNSIFIFNYD